MHAKFTMMDKLLPENFELSDKRKRTEMERDAVTDLNLTPFESASPSSEIAIEEEVNLKLSSSSDSTPISSPNPTPVGDGIINNAESTPTRISTSPPQIPFKYIHHFYEGRKSSLVGFDNSKEYIGVGDLKNVPRTVPCVVLAGKPQNTFVSPLLFPPSPLFQMMPTTIGRKYEEFKSDFEKNSETATDLVVRSAAKLSFDEEVKHDVSKKLTFGMDRILAEDKGADAGKLDERERKCFQSGSNSPIPENEIKSIPLPLASPPFNLQSHLHHHQPGYSTHCSECILLSRCYYKIQMPVPRSLTNYTNYSWLNSQSILDSPGSSGTSFGHSASALSTSFGFNAGNYASMVSCNNSNAGGRRKRSWSRAVFSNLQRKGLEKRFQIQKYITKPDRRDLAAALGLSDAQVKVWFQNRRMKWRATKPAASEK